MIPQYMVIDSELFASISENLSNEAKSFTSYVNYEHLEFPDGSCAYVYYQYTYTQISIYSSDRQLIVHFEAEK